MNMNLINKKELTKEDAFNNVAQVIVSVNSFSIPQALALQQSLDIIAKELGLGDSVECSE